jgi:hypothetical protein
MINNNITPNEIFYKLNILSFICFYEFEFEFPIAQWLIKKNNLIGYKSNIENITKLKKLAENKLKKRIDKL